MRRALLGLLVVGLVVWFSLPDSSSIAADEPAGSGELSALLHVPAGAGDARGSVGASPHGDGELEAAFGTLIAGLERGDAEAKAQAERLLARTDLVPEHRHRLQVALSVQTPVRASDAAATKESAPSAIDPAEVVDLATVFARLGENNAFLRTADGRALGRRGLELVHAEKDEAALSASTKLLERCMRGPIQKADVEAIAFVDAAYKLHKPLADRLLCDPANVTRSRTHVVVKGDTMGKIASGFRKEGLAVDETSLAILNRIHNPNAIRPGQRIRCPIDPIRAVVEKKSFLLAVYVGEQVLRLYWVGHGADDKTPVTEFVVLEKLKDPDWYSPDGRVYAAGSPENILGRYFLKFDNPSYTGFGAHGTPYPETIGTMSSMGCIRMYDADIEELYKLLPRKAKVEVRDAN